LAKNVVRSSSTQLVVTRPDAFSPDDSPYTVKVVNPGIPVPSGSDAYLLVDSVTAGTNPAWQTTGDLLYNIGAASADITLLATDSEGTDIDYSVVSGTLPAGITLVEETGVLSGTFSGSASEGDTNSVTFKAIDTGGNFLNKAFNFVANANPVWTTAAGALTANPAPGVAYSFQLVASGGAAGGALTYTVESGALSAGLSLSSSGLISGTSSDAVNTVANFTVRVTDTAGLFADRTFSLTTKYILIEYLVIAGGGGAGSYYSGGGGAGGYRGSVIGEMSGGGASAESALRFGADFASGASLTISVGTGGSASFDSYAQGYSGGSSTFHTIEASGGGGGGSNTLSGVTGGSGGGRANANSPGSGMSGQGFAGGSGQGSGGGGGGQAGNSRGSGQGGLGVQSSITGTPTYRAEGGWGWSSSSSSSTAGYSEAGAGGGESSSGKTGIIILRFPDTLSFSTTGSVTANSSTVGNNTVVQMTGNGTIAIS